MEKIFLLLRDAVWQFVGVIVTTIGLWFTWKQLQRKSLSVEFIDSVGVLDIPKEFRDKLEVRFDSKLIKQLHVVVIKIVNSGNTTIRPSDYYRPINIGFGAEAKTGQTHLIFERSIG